MTKLIYIYGRSPEARATIRGRLTEAARQAELGEVSFQEFALADVDRIDWEKAFSCILGPELNTDTELVIDKLRAAYPLGAVALLLNPDEYATRAVALRRTLAVHVCSTADLAHLSGFLLSAAAEPTLTARTPYREATIGVCQLKGGVGATTLSAALSACWARHGLGVALVDLDDVNPHLTAWAQATPHQRAFAAHCLRRGEIDRSRVEELLAPIEGFDGKFVVVPQPEPYHEAFHTKADLIEDAPSASAFINAIGAVLGSELDIVTYDLGRSWGIGTFAALKRCSHVVLVVDDDAISLDRTLANLSRLRAHSDDPNEFNFSRWSVVLNGYTGRNVSADEAAAAIARTGLFPTDANLYTLPYSKEAERWSEGRRSLYETADQRTRDVVRRIACNVVPFQYEQGEHRSLRGSSRLRRGLARFG
jgi:cellulose biosynthesis protein BcsQ